MRSRIPVRSIVISMMFLVFLHARARGEGAGQPGSAGEPLTVTIELPRTSPDLRALSPSEIEAAAADGIVRLRVPVNSERLASLPLAVVADARVTLGDLRRALVSAGQQEGSEQSPPPKPNPMEVLKRLVETRLVAREGVEIGLDELPEVQNFVDVFSRKTMREFLILRRIKGIDADEAEVEKLYRDAIREWRIKALTFKEEKDAEEFRGAVLAGTAFEEAAQKYVSEGKAEAKGGKEGEFVKTRDISPAVADSIGDLKPGSVTKVIGTGDRFAVIRLEEVRMSESPEARAQAKQRARNFAQNRAIEDYNRQLTARYVKLDKELFEKLDFGGSAENFLKLMEDGRVVARVEGDEPVTVSVLAKGIREQYYHGMKNAIEQGTINEKKIPVLNDIVFKKVFHVEALAQGIDKTPEFADAVSDYRNSVIFGMFVEKVLRPDITVAPSDLDTYYKDHIDRFTTPGMVKLKSLVFGNASAAQAALDKLKKGTDFGWVKANAEGQVKADDGGTGGIEGVMIEKSLPETLRQGLQGADDGAFVFYRQNEKSFQVVNVERRIPPKVRPFDDVRPEVQRDVFRDKIEKALKDWTERLKKAYGAEVYAKEFSGSSL